MLIAVSASAQRPKKKDTFEGCAIPIPKNERPDTITKYIFGMTNKTIPVKSIPHTKPKDNNILHSKYGTIQWVHSYAKDPSLFAKSSLKQYTITDTTEILIFGMKYTLLEYENKEVNGYLAYQDISGENEYYFLLAGNDKKRKALLNIVQTYFK